MHILLIISILFSVANLAAVSLKAKRVEYITKPGTILFLTLWFGFSTHLSNQTIWVGLALLFSLAGDIFLMLPDKLIPGLISFLLAHICYIVWFNPVLPSLNLANIFILLLVSLTSATLLRAIIARMRQRGATDLVLPIVLYTIVISLMVISAANTLVLANWQAIPAILSSIGAVLFYFSDSMIAWDKFHSPLSWRNVKVMLTYHLGQYGLVVGAVLHYLHAK